MSDPIRVAIGTILEEDATLLALATGGVHYGYVTDQSLDPPFCIFHSEGGDELWASQGAGLERDTWVVKGAGPDQIAVEDIDARCRELLDNVDLNEIALFCRRLGAIAFGEDVKDGDPNFYRGSRYRVITNAD